MIREFFRGTKAEQTALNRKKVLEKKTKLGPKEKEELPHLQEISRRLFLRNAVVGGSGAAVLGLGGLEAARLILSQHGTQETQDGISTNLVDYYPEIGVSPQAQGDFLTQGNKNVSWYNFTNMTIEPNALQQLFDYYETVAARRISATLVEDNDILSLRVIPSKVKQVGLFITPKDAPNPKWVESGNPTGSQTAKNFKYGLNLTSIKVDPVTVEPVSEPIESSSNEQYPNLEFYIEIAQNCFDVTTDRPSSALIAQENFANSYAYAIYMRQQNSNDRIDVQYSKYRAFIDTTRFQRNDLPELQKFRTIYLTPEQYSALPLIPQIIHR